MLKRLLLISNSVSHGQGYLHHCESAIKKHLSKIKTITFIPYALYDRDKYTSIARTRYEKMGFSLISVHETKNPKKAVEQAEALFIGGGNTFRLLNELYKYKLMDITRKRVENGIPYIGTSAGSNVACPTIKTTNDMPIVYPPSFDALNLVPFQINPHYLDPDPNLKHMGETRVQRLKEFHEENDTPVVGLREGSWISVKNNSHILEGTNGAKLFLNRKDPLECESGTDFATYIQ